MVIVSQIPVKTFLSKSKIPGTDYVINPYVGCPHKCVYCYAEYMRKFTGHQEPWGDFLDVRQSPVPLRPFKLFHTHVLLSSVTDPYNPYEKQYQVTRSLLKQLQYCQAYVHILTKSSLVTRDIDILKKLPDCEVTFSFSCANESLREQVEPGACRIEERIKALQFLHEQGIRTRVMVAPLLPGLSDWQQIIEQTRPYTLHYNFDSLNLTAMNVNKMLHFIEAYYPQHLALYSDIYIHENTSYWKQLAAQIQHYVDENQLAASLFFTAQDPELTKLPPLL